MDECTYRDERCQVLALDPRLGPPPSSRVTIELWPAELRITTREGGVFATYPLRAIQDVRYLPCRLQDFPEIYDRYYDEGVAPSELEVDLHVVEITVRDPEGVLTPGIMLCLACRDEYHAKVLSKRLGTTSALDQR